MDFLLRSALLGLDLGLPAYAIGFAGQRNRRVGGAFGVAIGVLCGALGGIAFAIGQDSTTVVVAPVLLATLYGGLLGSFAARTPSDRRS